MKADALIRFMLLGNRSWVSTWSGGLTSLSGTTQTIAEAIHLIGA